MCVSPAYRCLPLTRKENELKIKIHTFACSIFGGCRTIRTLISSLRSSKVDHFYALLILCTFWFHMPHRLKNTQSDARYDAHAKLAKKLEGMGCTSYFATGEHE